MNLITTLFSAIIIFLSACNSNNSSVNEEPINVEEAKAWTKKNLETFFNDKEGDLEWLKSICTDRYYEYKLDAMQAAFDWDEEEATVVKLDTKWGDYFKNHQQAMYSGFFISAQDWTHIEIESISKEKHWKDKVQFGIELLDTGFNAVYPIKVTVQKTDGKLLISNIIEN